MVAIASAVLSTIAVALAATQALLAWTLLNKDQRREFREYLLPWHSTPWPETMDNRLRRARSRLRNAFVLAALGAVMASLAFPSLLSTSSDGGRISADATIGGRAGNLVRYVRYMNPIAYRQKSWQTTQFYASLYEPVDQAVLSIDCPAGNKLLFNGPIRKTTDDFFFPSWDGSDSNGRRLPTGFYQWRLVVTKDGRASTSTGTIIVSQTCTMLTGEATAGDQGSGRVYFIPGRGATCYMQAETNAGGEKLRIVLHEEGGVSNTIGEFAVPQSPLALDGSVDVPYPIRLKSPVTLGLDIVARSSIRYRITFIQ